MIGAEVAGEGEDLVFQLVQLRASATGKPLTDGELTFIASYPRELAAVPGPAQLAGRARAAWHSPAARPGELITYRPCR
jgi:hypothetical protein